MPAANREVRPCQKPGHVLNEHAAIEPVPPGWGLLPPGDAALSRRVKAAGPSWTVIEMRGRKRFSHGIWAPSATIETVRAALRRERDDPSYQRKLDAARRRRDAAQTLYVGDFRRSVSAFLAFHPLHAADADFLAHLIAIHATPVGSGTVARTERIPIEERAEAATIAWLRHQTTGYDHMRIPLIKGRRREVRRALAEQSQRLLRLYREGRPINPATCPLQAALRKARPVAPAAPAPIPTQGTLF